MSQWIDIQQAFSASKKLYVSFLKLGNWQVDILTLRPTGYLETKMDYLINITNILYLFSYLVRDILWLRIMTVIAASCLIPYFYFRPDPLIIAICWNLLFTSLNIFWIGRLLVERRPVQLSGNDLHLYQLVFRCLTPREMQQLLKLGRLEKAAEQ